MVRLSNGSVYVQCLKIKQNGSNFGRFALSEIRTRKIGQMGQNVRKPNKAGLEPVPNWFRLSNPTSENQTKMFGFQTV